MGRKNVYDNSYQYSICNTMTFTFIREIFISIHRDFVIYEIAYSYNTRDDPSTIGQCEICDPSES